jgi:tetratricopeptide (TPR) repeat protein
VGFYNFLGWFEANKKLVAIGAGVLVAAGLVVGLLVWRSAQRVIDAEEALGLVRMPFSPIDLPTPGTAEALVKVARDFPDTPAAAKAYLRAGTVYFGDGNYPKAREQFDAYLRNPGETPWVSEAVFGIAASLDAENKATEAIEKYKSFIEKYPSDPSVDQARLNLARIYERTGQPQLAFELLTKITSPQQQGNSPHAAEAQEKMKALLAKHPSLMPVAPPPQAPQVQINPNPNVSSRPLVLKPEEPANAPKIIVNPSQPTPGQPNPTQVTPGQPVPAQPVPAAPAPGK